MVSPAPQYACRNPASRQGRGRLTFIFLLLYDYRSHYATVSYARGMTLGGSSTLNAILYQREIDGLYQAWADTVEDVVLFIISIF